jgi:tyrosinase
MSIRIVINHSENPRADYITWSPSPCSINVTDGIARTVVIKNKNPNSDGGQMVFMNTPVGPVSDQLTLNLPANGNVVEIFIAGKYDQSTPQGKAFASNKDKDAIMVLLDGTTSAFVGEKALMVRVRKNANILTAGERDRFLGAFVRFNQSGKFVDFQNRHLGGPVSREIHGRSSFLVWHRAFLLDLERQLQADDPSVCLPYWKFDEASPKVFTKDFMGIPGDLELLVFSDLNPLKSWKLQVNGEGPNSGIKRGNYATDENGVKYPWKPASEKAIAVQNTEALTLQKEFGIIYKDFSRKIESDPHGSAHVSFNGQLSNISRAPADPLFFMLHGNIDRLWAKWQWLRDGQRFNITSTDTYPHLGAGTGFGIKPPSREGGIGDFTEDTMWPWNGVKGNPRPEDAPGGPFPKNMITQEPGAMPKVKSMIDYHGQFNKANNLNFAYDDVPFDFTNNQDV